MDILNHREYYEYLEARHRKFRVVGLIVWMFFALVAFSNYFLGFSLGFEEENENRLILILSITFMVHGVRTWKGSDELRLLRELFR